MIVKIASKFATFVNMGLGQGNDTAPPGFLAVCTLMINVYRRLGHGTKFVGAWLRDAFMLAAVLYVDYSDQLHMAKGYPTNAKFLALVQSATDDWAGLVHASGSSLKPQKCFWYMLGWRWVNGVPRLRKLCELPQTPLTIPQPDGTHVAIRLKDVNDPEKKLGVYTCPRGDFAFHVAQCCTVGLECAAKLSACNLPPRDAWMGTRYQLYPKLIYGAVAITHSPKKLEETFQSIWYKLLPLLKVNRHITKEFCMLPIMFQGLALSNPNIDVLSRKVHLIQNEWGTNRVMGKLLHHSYQIFQVKVGLHGNIFNYSFDSCSDLATHGFFQNMWQLLRMFGVNFRIQDTFDIPLLQKDDRTIMDSVADTGIFSKS
jgi:hypothetical protein